MRLEALQTVSETAHARVKQESRTDATPQGVTQQQQHGALKVKVEKKPTLESDIKAKLEANIKTKLEANDHVDEHTPSTKSEPPSKSRKRAAAPRAAASSTKRVKPELPPAGCNDVGGDMPLLEVRAWIFCGVVLVCVVA